MKTLQNAIYTHIGTYLFIKTSFLKSNFKFFPNSDVGSVLDGCLSSKGSGSLYVKEKENEQIIII